MPFGDRHVVGSRGCCVPSLPEEYDAFLKGETKDLR
jgi:hypothetical protein